MTGRQPEKGGELARAGESEDVLDACHDRGGRDGTDAGYAHQAARGGKALEIAWIARGCFLVESAQLANERHQRRSHALWNHVVTFGDESRKGAGSRGPLRAEDPDLGKMAAEGVDQLRSLRDQHLADLVVHQHRLVVDRANGHEAHGRTGHRFADRSCVGGNVLLAPDIGLYVGRRH